MLKINRKFVEKTLMNLNVSNKKYWNEENTSCFSPVFVPSPSMSDLCTLQNYSGFNHICNKLIKVAMWMCNNMS